MIQRLTALCALLVCALVLSGCTSAKSPPEAPKEHELQVTLGGFLVGGPEDEKVDGICSVASNRTSLSCEVYNGLPQWDLTEITFRVAWRPYDDDHSHLYRQTVHIPSLTTGRVSFSLGTQLPADTVLFKNTEPISHWTWLVVGAKGVPKASK